MKWIIILGAAGVIYWCYTRTGFSVAAFKASVDPTAAPAVTS